MARITPSALISQIRGSLGGVTFKGSRSGAVVQSRSIGKYADTPRGQEHTRFLAAARAQWDALSPGLQTGWETLASGSTSNAGLLGKGKLYGRELFLQWYLCHLHCGTTWHLDLSTIPQAPLFVPVRIYGGFYQEPQSLTYDVRGIWFCLAEFDGATYDLEFSIWANWPTASSQKQSRFWTKILPTIGGPSVSYAAALQSYLWQVIGPPIEQRPPIPGTAQERFVPWIKGYCSMFRTLGGASCPQTSIGLMPPRPWRPISGIGIDSVPGWPTPYYWDKDVELLQSVVYDTVHDSLIVIAPGEVWAP